MVDSSFNLPSDVQFCTTLCSNDAHLSKLNKSVFYIENIASNSQAQVQRCFIEKRRNHQAGRKSDFNVGSNLNVII